jgi:acetyltransferase-like isoleucine patch superfamily enzyme
MSGRDLFEKHGKKVQYLIKIAQLFPKSFRKNRLAASCMSRGVIGQLKRYVWISTLAKSVGENVAIYPNVYFEHVDRLSIGNNVSIHQMCYIDAGGEISIGNDVSIAHRTTVLSSNHRYSG